MVWLYNELNSFYRIWPAILFYYFIPRRRSRERIVKNVLRKWIDLEGANLRLRAKIWFTQKKGQKQFVLF